jgi:hypothetical protein
MSNGPVPHDDDGHDLDAINELQFKLDKKNKEFEKVCSIPLYNFYETEAKSYCSCTYISHNKKLEHVFSAPVYNFHVTRTKSCCACENIYIC